jgi:hypothetical protein
MIIGEFHCIYQALFRNHAIEQGSTDFLRVAFLDFAMNHWGRGYVDHKLMKDMRVSDSQRFLTQTEFAAKIGVRRVTVARWLKASRVFATRVKCGKANRILVDANWSAIPRTAPGEIFRKREAAWRLGISVSLLQALKEASIYEVKNLPPTRSGTHELDLQAFSRRFFAVVSQSDSRITGTEGTVLKFVACGRHDRIATKLGFLRAILNGEIAILGKSNGTIRGLLLDKTVCRRFILNARSPAEKAIVC